MKNFEFNWATAEMVKMYLRNSRAQEKRKARKAAEDPTVTEDMPSPDPRPIAASGTTESSSDDSDSEDDDDN